MIEDLVAQSDNWHNLKFHLSKTYWISMATEVTLIEILTLSLEAVMVVMVGRRDVFAGNGKQLDNPEVVDQMDLSSLALSSSDSKDGWRSIDQTN